jgi:hypothetical protein
MEVKKIEEKCSLVYEILQICKGLQGFKSKEKTTSDHKKKLKRKKN